MGVSTPPREGLPLDSESDRFALHDKVRQVLGAREGDILMEHLPPVGWTHLAAKDDLALTRVEMREEMAELRTELKSDMAELRAELKREMSELRTELKTDMARLRADVERGFRNQTWRLVTALTASNAVMLAAVGLMVSSPG